MSSSTPTSQPDLAQSLVVVEAFRMIGDLATAAFNSRLTGLLNKSAFSLLAAHHDRGQGPRLAVAFLDLTGFKSVNDRYGHDAGDAVIKAAGAALRELCQSIGGYAYHASGDEFLAVFEPERMETFCQLARTGTRHAPDLV